MSHFQAQGFKEKSHLQKEKKEREREKKKSLLQPEAISWLQSSGPSLKEEKHCGLGDHCAAHELRELSQLLEGWEKIRCLQWTSEIVAGRMPV